MICRAQQDHPDLRFALGDIGSEDGLCGGPFDVIFSNACLQWVAEHTRLLPRLLAQLSPGGVLAVQVPMNYEEPIHRILSGLASDPAWQNKFAQPRRFYTLTPEGLLCGADRRPRTGRAVADHLFPRDALPREYP